MIDAKTNDKYTSCSYHAHQVPSTLSLIRERSKDVIESWLGVSGVLYHTLMSNF